MSCPERANPDLKIEAAAAPNGPNKTPLRIREFFFEVILVKSSHRAIILAFASEVYLIVNRLLGETNMSL